SSVRVRFQLIASSTTLPIAAVTLIAQTTATANRARETITPHSLPAPVVRQPRQRGRSATCQHLPPSRADAVEGPARPRISKRPPGHSLLAMTNSLTTYRRRGGSFLIAGALLTIAGAVLSAIVQGSSSVPDDLVRYPFSHDAFLPFTVFAATCHLLML